MTEPVIVPRAEHPISRRDIDPDALKVLYRLHESGAIAYLVGGSVRDLLLSRRPKDFDIGTSAHPYQVKKLFRNCWIIGRRFRLAHVRFGLKTIEVATFRKNVPAGTESEPPRSRARRAPADSQHDPAPLLDPVAQGRADAQALLNKHQQHDNTFGTPEEDAFRRDFTINALFYDIATFSIIDYVGGLQDLKDGLIRSIGDPNERFQEDPVRMLRAIVMASRLNFRLDRPIVDAIADASRPDGDGVAVAHDRGVLQDPALRVRGADVPRARRASPARSGHAGDSARREERGAVEQPRRARCLPAQVRSGAGDAAKPGPARLDADPARTDAAKRAPPLRAGRRRAGRGRRQRDRAAQVEGPAAAGSAKAGKFRRPPKEPILKIGMLPIARGDTERLRQVLSLQSRIADLEMSPRAKRALMHRGPFEDSLTWFEIHGNAPAVLEHWKGFIEALGDEAKHPPAEAETDQPAGDGTGRRRRRGRRRRGRRGFKRPPET